MAKKKKAATPRKRTSRKKASTQKTPETRVEIRQFYARPGAMYGNETAQLIGEWLDGRGGQTSPREFLDAAVPVDSPFHQLFDWDDRKAADTHRMNQARRHLAGVQVKVRVANGTEERIRYAHSVVVVTQSGEEDDQCEGSRYVALDQVLKNPVSAAQVVSQAKKELQAFKRKYVQYSQVFGGIFAVIDEVLEADDAA